jgi:fatty acid synthase subunit alpha, fungi type
MLTVNVQLTEKFGLAKVKDLLKDIVNNCYDHALEKQKTEGYIVLERRLATIPLAGIDVPFHSHYLWPGVMPFCACECSFALCSLSLNLSGPSDLLKKISSTLLDPSLLEGIYIPNLIPSPFAVNKAYAELIYNRTSSPRLSKVLRKWNEEGWDAPEQRQKLAWVPLVELLSYQFASPMCWIETQDLFFGQYKFECFIEIGPSPTLTGMAVCTLKAKYEAKDGSTSLVHRVFCPSKHQKEIYYQLEDETEVTWGWWERGEDSWSVGEMHDC